MFLSRRNRHGIIFLNAESKTRQGGSVLNGKPKRAGKAVGWVEQSETHQHVLTAQTDDNGNRVQEIREAPQVPVSLAVATTTFRYNPPANRLLSTTNATTDRFTYDAQGQTLTQNGTPYTWDDEHRLTGQGNSQYFYDGVGNRLKAINHGITTKYIYDARGNLIAEANASNAITSYYIYGAGLLAMVQNNNVYTYHHDALGNTVAITNNTRRIINTYSYTPYGQIVDQTETLKQPFKYVGKYGVMTEAHGLYYMRARYYDPATGRFISEDPKGLDAGVNLYAYVGGNPIMLMDPSGLIGQCASVDCIIYGGTQPENVGGPSLEELNKTTPGEVAAALGIISLATGVGNIVLGAQYLGDISLGTAAIATLAVPSSKNISGTLASILSRGVINPLLGNAATDMVDSYNLLFSAGSLAKSGNCP